MNRRLAIRFRPDLEKCEEKRLLSAGGLAVHASTLAAAHSGAAPTTGHRAVGPGGGTAGAGYIAYRLTNPTYRIIHLIPPFQSVAVQNTPPVPGKTYNLLYMVVRNGTGKTFTASDGFTTRVPGFTGSRHVSAKGIPVLTGNQTWAPNQWIVFYILSKKYYPLSPQDSAGFQLQAGGRSSTIIPGPSGIFLRLKYDPATFNKTLDWIVAYGQGAQLGPGAALGMPDTAINLLVSAGSQRFDYAGHF
jgi:hypothetical protein